MLAASGHAVVVQPPSFKHAVAGPRRHCEVCMMAQWDLRRFAEQALFFNSPTEVLKRVVPLPQRPMRPTGVLWSAVSAPHTTPQEWTTCACVCVRMCVSVCVSV